MGEYVGVDWAGKRWVVVRVTDDAIDIGTQPSIQTVWDRHSGADQILVDIPIGLPEKPELAPRPCDEQARKRVSGIRSASIFDAPCRAAVQARDYDRALKQNADVIDDQSLGPQKWGFSERIHEVDVFMRHTTTETVIRESHPEICFAALSPDGAMTGSKQTDSGVEDRLDILDSHDRRFRDAFEAKRAAVLDTSSWKRRIGVGMLDDVLDAMVLAYTAKLGSEGEFSVLGGEKDAEGLPMEIVYHEGRD